MEKLKDPDFFKRKTYEGQAEAVRPRAGTPQERKAKQPEVRVDLGEPLSELISRTSAELAGEGQKRLAAAVEAVRREAGKNSFTVAVVGEFNSGKSTLVNRLIERDILPTGLLPTTALMTRIRYSGNETMTIFDTAGTRKGIRPAERSSWEGLTAENFGGKDPVGTVLVGIRSPWLGKSRLEIVDTPGVGDLEERRAKVVSDAIFASDAAIITTRATQPLGLSEKLFIEQRLLSHRTPFLMLAVTMLDDVPTEERAGVIDYIRKKLELWRQEDPEKWRAQIPVVIPYETETTDESLKSVMGLENIRRVLSSWVTDPERVRLTREWVASRAAEYVDLGILALREKQALLAADEEKRQELIAQKEEKLEDAARQWESMRLEMMKRCGDCCEMFRKRAGEYASTVTERLQYEVSHSGNPRKWWLEDYPYRLKVELASMASGLENAATKRITEDARWFNTSMEQSFKTHVLVNQDTIVDKIATPDTGEMPELEDLDRQRVAARVGTTVLTIAGYAICASMGALPILATMGIGTGASVVSEKIFKSKVEKQREALKEALARNVPLTIEEAVADSEQRLQSVYGDMIGAARTQEDAWMQTQREIIRGADNGKPGADSGIKQQIERLMELKSSYEAVIS